MSEQTKQSGYASVIHISVFMGSLANLVFPLFFNILFPLVLWLLKSKESKFVDWHGREAVRFQIFLTIYAVTIALLFVFFFVGTLIATSGLGGGIIIGLITVAYVFNLAFLILNFIFPVIAAVQAYSEKYYCYPLVFSPRKKFRNDLVENG